jgi:4-amino-4-deoxy-L-arabinose transferase-like glycosyltransferase
VFYYLIALLAGLFPWSIFMSPTCVRTARRLTRRDAAWQADLLLACWVVVWVGFFSLAGTKLPSYIAPAYPAVALLTARWIVGWLEAPESIARGWLRSGFAVLGCVGLVAAIGLPLAIEHWLSHAHEYRWGLLAAPLLVAAVAGWIASERGQARRAAGIVAVAAVLFLSGVLGLGAGRVDDFQYTVPLAARIRAELERDQPPIISFRYMRPSLVFYSRHAISEVDTARDVVDFFNRQSGPALLVTSAPQFRALQPLLPPDVEVLETHPPFLKGDPLVLVGRAPRGAGERTESAADPRRDSLPPR